MGQYGLPQKQPMTPGTPRVSPAIRELHGLLDTSVGELIKTKAPQYTSMLPADLAGKPLREIINTSNFLMRGTIMSYLEPEIRKMGLTTAQVEQAVKEPPPPPEAPQAPPQAPQAAPAAAAPPQAPAPAAAPAAPAASQYALPPSAPAAAAAAAAPAAPAAAAAAAGPKAFVFHHTGGGSSPKGIVDDWRTNRPGIGTQYIMDREGIIHDVKAEFGYEGKGHVHPGYTPKEFKDKGILNKNIVGMEIMAKDAKDVTPAQAAAAAKFVQEKYPNVEVYGHGELNPGHRQADEGQAAKAAVMALRNTPATPSTAVPEVQAGAGPAAIAAARKADLAPAPAEAIAKGTQQAAAGANIPAGTSPETTAAINSLAARLGVSPDAISGVIKTESNFNPGARSPGKGTYGGLTQIGPDTFKEAGGKLGGLTHEEFLKASPDKQLAAYGGYLDHYKFGDKAKAAGIDFSKMSPAQQAAHLQAFQFSPAVSSWQGGDPNKPVTASKQAAALGTTSLNDMTKYYDKLLAKSEAPDKGSTTTGLLDPTPNVGAGESKYLDDKLVDPTPNVGSGEGGYSTPPSFPSVDPTPNVGSGGSDYGGAGDLVASGGGDMGGGLGGMGGFGDALEGMASLFSKGPVAQNAAQKSSPANAPLATLPTPPGLQPIVDPRVADAQRQQLAMALQRLNSGRLV